MASLVNAVLIPLRGVVYSGVAVTTTPTPAPRTRPPGLACRWVLDDRAGRPVARWVAEPELAGQEMTDPSDQAVA